MSRRNELRDKALDYLLQHGLAELSLRPLAAQIGTSARLLTYHFESKEKLIMVVMEQVRARVQQSVVKMMHATRGVAVMESVWHWATDPEHMPYVRLLFEVQVLALQHPATYAQFLTDSSASWLNVIEHGLPESTDRRITATFCSALIDGLVLDYMSTGDLDRTTAALKYVVSLLERQRELASLQAEESR